MTVPIQAKIGAIAVALYNELNKPDNEGAQYAGSGVDDYIIIVARGEAARTLSRELRDEEPPSPRPRSGGG